MTLTQEVIAEVFLGMIVIPWVVWITVNIFQVRQELALLKQIFALLEKKLG